MDVTNEIKGFAKSIGSDCVGIADAERLRGAPVGRRPRDILPGARSVVVMGLRMLEAVVESLPGPVYMNTGYMTLNAELNRMAYQVAKFIEDRGFRAVPMPATRDYDMKEIRGTFSVVHAAVEAGLGEIGLSGLLLTPEYGPRMRFVSVITTMELRPDRPMEAGLCTQCGLCVEHCPTRAIGEDVGFDAVRCLSQTMIYTGQSEEEVRRQIESLRQIPRPIFIARALVGRNILPPLCGMCVKVCPVGARKLK